MSDSRDIFLLKTRSVGSLLCSSSVKIFGRQTKRPYRRLATLVLEDHSFGTRSQQRHVVIDFNRPDDSWLRILRFWLNKNWRIATKCMWITRIDHYQGELRNDRSLALRSMNDRDHLPKTQWSNVGLHFDVFLLLSSLWNDERHWRSLLITFGWPSENQRQWRMLESLPWELVFKIHVIFFSSSSSFLMRSNDVTLFNRTWAHRHSKKICFSFVLWFSRLEVRCDHIDKIYEVHPLARVPRRYHLAVWNLSILGWGWRCIFDTSDAILLLMFVGPKTIVVGNSWERLFFFAHVKIHPSKHSRDCGSLSRW